jgi:SHS family lactate transporter-like MFS transporter
LTAVANTENWRVIFYIAAGISLAAALLRIALPESTDFADRQAEQIAAGSTVSSGQKSATFIREAGKAMKLHWRRAIFAVSRPFPRLLCHC